MNILKFGGTSVGAPERMQHVARLIRRESPVIVVLSAVSGTTNSLVEISKAAQAGHAAQARALTDALAARYVPFVEALYQDQTAKAQAQAYVQQVFDQLRLLVAGAFGPAEEKITLAQGELISTHLFQYYLQSLGLRSVLLPALDFMRSREGEPDMETTQQLFAQLLATAGPFDICLTQGYICRDEAGHISNLGRGGSDYTACILGALLPEAGEVQIWTDIDGMHNNDPRLVSHTFPVRQISFDEAAELAYFGAKILHPTCIWPCQQRNIPIRLLNTMQPEAPGTLITRQTTQRRIKAIAAKDQITAIKIKSDRMLLAYGFLRRVFEIFERYKTPIDMITTSEVALSVTIDQTHALADIRHELEAFARVEVEQEQTIICIVGQLLQDEPGIVVQVLKALEAIPVRMISYGGSPHNLSLLVSSTHKKAALNLLNEGLFEEVREMIAQA